MILFQVDAFARRPFTGNPAAVLVLDAFPDATWMQQLAAEMNLSETAFLVPLDLDADPAEFALRWFTPTAEVDLCGHATLASAHVLWTEWRRSEWSEGSAPDALAFDTASGRHHATRSADDLVCLVFPADPPSETPPPDGLLEALGVSNPVFVGRSERDFLVHLEDAAAVDDVSPDMHRLACIDTRGVIVTAPAADASDGDAAADFVSRFFGPRVGVPEDPVTGSAHCALAPYWADRTGRRQLIGRQTSPRGGTVRVEVTDAGHVELSGKAVTIFRADLHPDVLSMAAS